MKFLFSLLLLSLISCETYQGNFEAFEAIDLENGKTIAPGVYDLDVKIKKKKVIFNVAGEKIKVKYNKLFSHEGEFNFSSQELNRPYKIDGNREIEYLEPRRVVSNYSCRYVLPTLSNWCGHRRRGRCLDYRVAYGMREVEREVSERIVYIDADLRDQGDNKLGKFTAKRSVRDSRVIYDSGCRLGGIGMGYYY